MAAQAWAQTVTVTEEVKKLYLGPEGATYWPSRVSNTVFDIEWKNGLCAWVWASTGFDREKHNPAKEVDFAGCVTHSAGPLSVNLDAAYFAVQNGDIMNINAEVVLWKTIFVRSEQFNSVKYWGRPLGTLRSVGLRTGKDWKHIGFNAESALKWGSAFGSDNAETSHSKFGVWIGGGRTRLTSEVIYFRPVTAVNDGRKKINVWSFGISRSFGDKK
jgi:hypothetical protein